MALERFIRRRGPAAGFREPGICPLIEVRSESDLRRSPDGDHLLRNPDQGLSATEIRKEFVHNGIWVKAYGGNPARTARDRNLK